MILPLLLALTAGPHCLDGYFDLGENAAALGFACATDESGKNIGANIRFCHREELLGSGTCNGRDDIPCNWQEEKQAWKCQQDGFEATILPISDDAISYHFKSAVGEGDLAGKRILFFSIKKETAVSRSAF